MRFRISTPATTIWPDWITADGRGLSHAEFAGLEEDAKRRCTRLALDRDGDRKGCVARWTDAQQATLGGLAGSHFHIGDTWERRQTITPNVDDNTHKEDEDNAPRERKEEPMLGGIKKLLGRSKAATTTEEAVELELEEESTVEQDNATPAAQSSRSGLDRLRELKVSYEKALTERDQRISLLSEQLTAEQQRGADLQAKLDNAKMMLELAEKRAAEAERFRAEIEREFDELGV